MILDTIDNWRNRFQSEPWVTIFSKLETLGPDSPDGRIEIMGEDAYGFIMGYPTRERAEGVCETHERKIDIQMCLKGSERIEWAPRGTLPVKTAYDPEKEAAFYQQPAEPLPGASSARIPPTVAPRAASDANAVPATSAETERRRCRCSTKSSSASDPFACASTSR
jgi:beta-galactosidase beta subunit